MRDIPPVTMEEFVALVGRLFPDATIEAEVVSPAHGSWSVDASRETPAGKGEVYVLWCPLTGFGGTDPNRLDPANDGDIFRPYDVGFASIEEAEAFVVRALGGEGSQS